MGKRSEHTKIDAVWDAEAKEKTLKRHLTLHSLIKKDKKFWTVFLPGVTKKRAHLVTGRIEHGISPGGARPGGPY